MDTGVVSELLQKHNITFADIDLNDKMRLKSLSELNAFIANK